MFYSETSRYECEDGVFAVMMLQRFLASDEFNTAERMCFESCLLAIQMDQYHPDWDLVRQLKRIVLPSRKPKSSSRGRKPRRDYKDAAEQYDAERYDAEQYDAEQINVEKYDAEKYDAFECHDFRSRPSRRSSWPVRSLSPSPDSIFSEALEDTDPSEFGSESVILHSPDRLQDEVFNLKDIREPEIIITRAIRQGDRKRRVAATSLSMKRASKKMRYIYPNMKESDPHGL
jgi:hypothetical protein